MTDSGTAGAPVTINLIDWFVSGDQGMNLAMGGVSGYCEFGRV